MHRFNFLRNPFCLVIIAFSGGIYVQNLWYKWARQSRVAQATRDLSAALSEGVKSSEVENLLQSQEFLHNFNFVTHTPTGNHIKIDIQSPATQFVGWGWAGGDRYYFVGTDLRYYTKKWDEVNWLNYEFRK
jgi:hypothetical protein